jgi:hypothetical protein
MSSTESSDSSSDSEDENGSLENENVCKNKICNLYLLNFLLNV